ncbi:MAG TPA: MFS transporter, partial [Micromonosporaceae bacterium]|nr:MFS transporter [Micromonosporaceae bacterium]
WLVAALLLLNSALVVLLQVRVGRRAGDVRQAARLVRLAGFLLLASTAAFATTGDLDAVPASVVLLGAATVYALGEVCHAAGGWALSYGLTDQELHGQYQGVFHAAEGIGIAVSPLVATGVVLQFAAPGWVAVGCLLAATGIVVARLSRQQDAAR